MPLVYSLLALDSPFSRPVLQTLLQAGLPPAALILPNPNRTALPTPLPPLTSSPLHLLSPALSLTQTASCHHIPLLTFGDLRHPDALAALRAYQPDLLITACFPRLLPPEMLGIPRLGCLNLHPSLLPAYRGPEPLFWQFYYGETHTGVTLHWMDEHADMGDIVSQAEVPFPDGISLAQAERLTAQAGAELLLRALGDPEQLPRTPQTGGSYHPHPISDDFAIPTTWTVKRAFNFICAARNWGPFEIVASALGQHFRVREALGFEEGWEAATPREPGGEEVWVRFADGVVKVRLT
jgi:methionyl-tRNA formyltransferase